MIGWIEFGAEVSALATRVAAVATGVSVVGLLVVPLLSGAKSRRTALVAALGLMIAVPIVVCSTAGTWLEWAVPVGVREAAVEAIPSALPIARPEVAVLSSSAVIEAEAVVPSPGRMALGDLLLLAWAAGSSIALLLGMLSVLRLMRLRGRRMLREDPRLLALAREASAAVGSAMPRVYECSVVRTPMLFGWLAPSILLPQDLDAELSDDELRAVFVHELQHFVQGDPWSGGVRYAAVAAFWWNPLAHVAGRWFERMSEYECDDAVVRAQSDPKGYARMLTVLAEDAAWSPRLPLPALLRRESPLVARVARLVAAEYAPGGGSSRGARAAVAVLSLVSLAAGAAVPTTVEVPVADGVMQGGRVKTGNATLQVQVVWDGGAPAAGTMVEVTVGGRGRTPTHRKRADEVGRVTFRKLPAGRVFVRGARGQGVDTVVRSGRTVSCRLRIRNGVDVRGTALDSQGRPVADAKVVVFFPWLHHDGVTLARTDTRGRFAIRDVPPGSRIGCQAAGRASASLELVPKSVKSLSPIRFVLTDANASLRVRVVDPEGRPVADAEVLLGNGRLAGFLAADAGTGSVGELLRTNAEGVVLSTSLGKGKLRVRVRAQGYAPKQVSVELRERATRTLEIRLEAGAIVQGRVLDPNGRPLAGATVTHGQSPVFKQVFTQTDRDGRFELGGLRSGRVRLQVRAQFSAAVQDVECRAGERTEVRLQLQRGRKVRGTVVDAKGKPVADANVYVRTMDKIRWASSVRTDRLGRFRLPIQGAGNATLMVTPRGSQLPVVVERNVPLQGEVRIVIRPEAQPSARVRGRIVRPDGRPAAGRYVRLTLGKERGTMVEVHADGSFESALLPPGKYRLTFQWPRCETFARDVQLDRSDVVDLGVVRLRGAEKKR